MARARSALPRFAVSTGSGSGQRFSATAANFTCPTIPGDAAWLAHRHAKTVITVPGMPLLVRTARARVKRAQRSRRSIVPRHTGNVHDGCRGLQPGDRGRGSGPGFTSYAVPTARAPSGRPGDHRAAGGRPDTRATTGRPDQRLRSTQLERAASWLCREHRDKDFVHLRPRP
jgi:hypothetical protein